MKGLQEQLPRTDIGNVEQEWENFKRAFVNSAKKTCGRTSGKVREKATKWWNDRVKER